MTQTVEIPYWVLVLIVGFAVIAALDRVMIPSVRWFFRRRLERAVARLNQRLDRPIQPFKLARRYDMIQRLIYDPEVTRAVAAHARAEGIPENLAFQQARRYAREIVPAFSATAYFGFAIRAARRLSNALYEVRVGRVESEALRRIDPDAAVVFVMNHRSNMDYVLVTYLAADRTTLSYAVGEWARVWPLSRLIRAMGAYFIRRRSRNELYRRVLARYVQVVTQAGVTQAMFPEGGLSLTGGLTEPKMGLLNYIVDGFDPRGGDVVFVPVALNYDRVLEDRILIGAAARSDRRFPARIGVIAYHVLRQGWLRLTGRYRRFGTAAVAVGHPVSLRAFLGAGPAEPTQALAQELMVRIGQVVPILTVPAVAYLLCRKGAEDRVALAAGLARIRAAHPVSAAHMGALDDGLAPLVGRGILREHGGRLHVEPGQGPVLDYYAASVAHLLDDLPELVGKHPAAS